MDNKIIGEFDFGISTQKKIMDFIKYYLKSGIEIMEYKKNGPAGGNFWMILSFPSDKIYQEFLGDYDPENYYYEIKNFFE